MPGVAESVFLHRDTDGKKAHGGRVVSTHRASPVVRLVERPYDELNGVEKQIPAQRVVSSWLGSKL